VSEPFDPVLLRSFVAVVEAGGFTRAAAGLGLGQPAVSQHVRKLEKAAGRQLLRRDTHSVAPTADGEAMLGFARQILAADARARGFFGGAVVRERLRFGASEDFVLSGLPGLLRDFVRGHQSVDLELTVGLSELLYEQLDHGALDLIFCKRREGDERGRSVWHDEIGWIGSERAPDPDQPVPLVLYPPPSVSRELAIATLDRAGRAWRIACTSGSLSGLSAAVQAGLGVMPHSRSLMPAGLVDVTATSGLPALGEVEFVVVGSARRLRGAAADLAQALVEGGARLAAGPRRGR
jgi:DNA-binding transcriptional LysR family regulator